MLGDPHAIPDTAFPADGTPADQLQFLLHYAALAPSVLNTQPWRFAIERNLVRLYADRTRQLRHLDPDGRELTVSCGAALLNLRVAARHFHRGTEAHPVPVADEPDLLAVLMLHGTAAPTEADEQLFHAIIQRRTNRHPFAEGPVPKKVLDDLERVAREEASRLIVLTGAAEKDAVARLVEEGIRLQGNDPRIAAELDAWLRPPGDPRRDGVSDDVQGAWDRRAQVRTPTSSVAVGKRELVTQAPAVLVLTTDTDGPADWLAAGQALGRVLLASAARDLQASYVNQVVEVAALRRELIGLIGGGFPQVVFRVGFPARHEGTPRRHMQDVLIHDPEAADPPRDNG
ncbi:MAG: nitroreductase [Rhodothermaceae bacterium]|nr:nitroreductase [Rhodothermaceae bacterium]